MKKNEIKAIKIILEYIVMQYKEGSCTGTEEQMKGGKYSICGNCPSAINSRSSYYNWNCPFEMSNKVKKLLNTKESG